jgi:hypothetical protein
VLGRGHVGVAERLNDPRIAKEGFFCFRRLQQAEAAGNSFGTFDWASEAADAPILPTRLEIFPEPRIADAGSTVNGFRMNNFFPWQLAQDGSVDAAVVISLAPGNYSVQVGDDAARGGSVLTEIYTAESVATATLVNLAARAPVAAGRPLIGGFVITGDAGTVQRLLLRGVGPGLAKFGVAGTLADPVIKVYNSAGALVASNDNWSGAEIAALAPFALDVGSKDAALIYPFTPGAYTLEVSTTGPSGEALAEIYSVAP